MIITKNTKYVKSVIRFLQLSFQIYKNGIEYDRSDRV